MHTDKTMQELYGALFVATPMSQEFQTLVGAMGLESYPLHQRVSFRNFEYYRLFFASSAVSMAAKSLFSVSSWQS